MDCVCAALSTIVKDSISQKSITNLFVYGHTAEATTLKNLKYVSTHADVGGKRKAEAPSSSGHKRSRLRQHRTAVAKRVHKLGDEILVKKTDYLESCPFVGVIVNEGNNWKRSCPVYTATISCDPEFH